MTSNPSVTSAQESSNYVVGNCMYDAHGYKMFSFQLCIHGTLLAEALTREELMCINDAIQMALAVTEEKKEEKL